MRLSAVIAGLTLLVALPAAAADTPASYTLTVSPAQVDILGRALALSQDPHKPVQDLITELSRQIVAQQKTEQKTQQETAPATPPDQAPKAE